MSDTQAEIIFHNAQFTTLDRSKPVASAVAVAYGDLFRSLPMDVAPGDREAA